jgi:hypothetical protein
MPSRKSKKLKRLSKKLKRLSKVQRVEIPITVDIANADTNANTYTDVGDINNNTYTILALLAMLIKTTVSTNIAQEELCISDSDKEQEYLNNTTIFLNNHSNKDISSAKMQIAKDPTTKLTSQDLVS